MWTRHSRRPKLFPKQQKKLKLISHRGNLHGKFASLENSPEYIEEAIDKGFDTEIDVSDVTYKVRNIKKIDDGTLCKISLTKK